MSRCTTIRTIVALLVCGAAVSAGQPAPDRAPAAWQRAVDTHVPGQLDNALRAIAPWSFDDVMAAVDGSQLDDRQLARALVLHTDLAIVQRTTESAARGSNGPAQLLDGRGYGVATLSWHWDVARHLARSAPTDARDTIVRAWFDATCALFLNWADYGELTRQLQVAGPWRERHPELLLYEGTLHQAYADARVQSFMSPRRPQKGVAERTARLRAMARRSRQAFVGEEPPPPHEEERARDGRDVGARELGAPEDASRERQLAEGLFRQALGLDPGLHEARIRLAHVLIDQGRLGEAAPLVREALAGSLPPFLAYYGALLHGRVDEAGGDFAAARGNFARAASLFPTAQTPRIALSRVAIVEGRSDDALSSLMDGVCEIAEPSDDPWLVHLRRRDPDAKTRLESFREQVQR